MTGHAGGVLQDIVSQGTTDRESAAGSSASNEVTDRHLVRSDQMTRYGLAYRASRAAENSHFSVANRTSENVRFPIGEMSAFDPLRTLALLLLSSRRREPVHALPSAQATPRLARVLR